MLAAEGIDLNQQRLQLGDAPQQVVGHEAHVGANAAQQAGQDDPLQGAEGVIGYHQHRAAGWDAGQIGGGDTAGDIQRFQNAVEEGLFLTLNSAVVHLAATIEGQQAFGGLGEQEGQRAGAGVQGENVRGWSGDRGHG